MRVLLWALATCVVGVAGAVPSVAGATSAAQAIAFLNAERSANGIPGDVTENPEWSDGCAKHAAYVERNGKDAKNPHSESRNKPGFTDAGFEAAQNSVLWEAYGPDGVNPWLNAPLHRMGLLNPSLTSTGYADGCMRVFGSPPRLAPDPPVVFTVPAGGRTVASAMRAAEIPFVPAKFVGIPDLSVTGPYLYVWAFGSNADGTRLTDASVVGPDGPVTVKVIDASTRTVNDYLAGGAIILPVKPLRTGTVYTATATVGAEPSFTATAPVVPQLKTWKFSTAPAPAPQKMPSTQSLNKVPFNRPFSRRVDVVFNSPAASTIVVTDVASKRRVARYTHKAITAEGFNDHGAPSLKVPLNYRTGRYRVCAGQAAITIPNAGDPFEQASWRFAAQKTCKTFRVRR